ncbi:MAG TPA: tetratricopeptide repeat protein [Gaiellaceae bacterium]|nr:tetratricopeptide repeat protein [Gaiellaceae bacterium]
MPRQRIVVIVALCAAAAASAVVGVTLIEMRGQTTTVPGAVTAPRPGMPQLELGFGLADNVEARTLAQAQRLYSEGRLTQAAALFGRYQSPAAQIGLAFARWSDGDGVQALQQLAGRYPRSALVALHLGWAYFWAGRDADAVVAWERTISLQPDSPYAVDAGYNLYAKKGSPPGLPPIVLALPLPGSLTPRKVEALRSAASAPSARAKLLYGWILWSLERPLSAEREFAAAARLAPHDAVARTAAAVGRFSWKDPTRAFAKLGPLTAVFPHSPAVEFHLGVLLLYVAERQKAARQLRAAIADGPHTAYAKPARQLLAGIAK